MNNHRAVLIVVLALAVIALAGEVGLFWLILNKVETQSVTILSQFASMALGALTGVLISTRTDPAKTEITNSPANPVQTHETPTP